jgi:methylated-DNA-[protein]-cysteine S-methyltransferase
MTNAVKYTIFKTRWGYFGLAADNKGLMRTVLPCSDRKTSQKHLLAGLKNAHYDKNLLKSLQGKIIGYFNGRTVQFNGRVPLDLDGMPAFTRKVLAACRKIPLGGTVSYSQLARMVGSPRAARAVGNALAKNPIPLIIPCHRVIRCNGSIGGFSATARTTSAGKTLKYELLHLEQTVS